MTKMWKIQKKYNISINIADYELTADLIKFLAKKGILDKYPLTGDAINFLLFGGFGVPGLIDDDILVNEALKVSYKQTGEKLTKEMATNLVQI